MIKVTIQPDTSQRWRVSIFFDNESWNNLARTYYGAHMGAHIAEDIASSINPVDGIEWQKNTFAVYAEGNIDKIKGAVDAVVRNWQVAIRRQQEHELRSPVELTYDL